MVLQSQYPHETTEILLLLDLAGGFMSLFFGLLFDRYHRSVSIGIIIKLMYI